MRLEKGPLNGNTEHFLGMLCDEFDLASLSVSFVKDKPVVAAFQVANIGTQDIEKRTSHFTLRPASDNPVEVRYIHRHVPDEEESHTASVCLSTIFKSASLKHLTGVSANLVQEQQTSLQ